MPALDPAPIFPFPITAARPLHLSQAPVDVGDLAAFTAYLERLRGDAPSLVGGYGEQRGIYAASALFGGPAADAAEEPRTLHLGIDVWAPAGTPLRAPLDGVVHSFADNQRFGDYGGTIVLTHTHPDGHAFHTLHGHLARRSLDDLAVGQRIGRGEVFAWIGAPAENGGWPPHLHLQWIEDMLGQRGDFPGVVRLSERERWLRLCPDPRPLLV
jgi:murein DD-endopeptidase MepM/ murein hydrolase activator NlpD